MQTVMFHSFMSSMLNNLSIVQREFEENQSFSADSEMSTTLEALATQIDNLRISLVKGYSSVFFSNDFGYENK